MNDYDNSSVTTDNIELYDDCIRTLSLHANDLVNTAGHENVNE